MLQLEQQLNLISKLAKLNRLPDAILTDSGLKITPLTNVVPPEIEALVQKIYGLLSHVKITALLLEVDNGQILLNSLPTLKMGLLRKIEYLYCINLGLQRWHICDKTYSAALATLVNAQSIHPLAENWGDGTTSSSDGQRFKVGSHATGTGHVNPKYGSERGVLFYTHVLDQYAPFHMF